MELSINKFILLLVSGVATVVSNSAFSAMDINVHGVISPSACTAGIIGGDNLDWGVIQHENLKQNELNTFPKKQVTLQVSCPAAQSIAFWATDPNENSAMVGTNTDGRIGHADSSRIFGLGMDPVTGKKLGNFTVSPVSSTVDGKTNSQNFGFQISGSHNGTIFLPVLSSAWSYKKTEDWTPWDESKMRPASGKSISWLLEIEPQLNTGSNITNTQRVDWQGTAQVNIRYF